MQGEKTALQKIRSIADYQFGVGAGKRIFSENIEIVYSKKTGRIRHVSMSKIRLATLRPHDGLFSLTMQGAKRLWESGQSMLWVKVSDEIAQFIAEGKSVFAKHVKNNDEEIRPKEEIIVINERKEVLAVGKAVLSGKEMRTAQKGVAVKVRRGALEVLKKDVADNLDNEEASDAKENKS